MSKGTLTYAGRVRTGDDLWREGSFRTVARVRRAQGRKPKVGENLHVVTDDDKVIKLNSADPVRIRRR